MSRKLSIVLIALMVAVAFVATLAIAADAPKQIVIEKVKAKKGGVSFDHEKHAGLTECIKCHHTGKDDTQSCFNCHGKDPKANDPTKGGKENPFHMVCQGCHKEQAKGPTKCNECHGGGE